MGYSNSHGFMPVQVDFLAARVGVVGGEECVGDDGEGGLVGLVVGLVVLHPRDEGVGQEAKDVRWGPLGRRWGECEHAEGVVADRPEVLAGRDDLDRPFAVPVAVAAEDGRVEVSHPVEARLGSRRGRGWGDAVRIRIPAGRRTALRRR